MFQIIRSPRNPLLKPEDVKASREGFCVDGVFNCGVARYKDEVILLCRVAESVPCDVTKEVKVPIVVKEEGEDRVRVITIVKDEHKDLDFSDSRTIRRRSGNEMKTLYLTSLSHIRIARSKNGVDFEIEDHPFIFPEADQESWGMEDPRITQIEDTYYINYTSVSKNGAATSLISTKDFTSYERHGLIFAPENKDVTIFPEKINGKYMAFNRPVPCSFGNPEIWLAESPDLLHWGKQRHFCKVSETEGWDNGRIGGGAVPFKTEKGWVKIYHGADRSNRYCLGVFLLDLQDPGKILGRSLIPLMEPEAEYELHGFFGNVVFTCGCLVEGGNVIIYYGAADDKICRADIRLDDIFKGIEYIN